MGKPILKIDKNATSDSYLERQQKLEQRLKSVKANRFKMSFGPKSVLAKSMRKGEGFEGGEAVVEFVKDPEYRYYMYLGFDTTGSQILADQKLDTICLSLRGGVAVLEEDATLLADALDRVRNSGQSINFLHGKKRVGRPARDRIDRFHIFKTIELQHTKLGKLSSSRKEEGAFDAARSILQSEGTYLEVDELRRIRQQVKQTASRDSDYFFELAMYLGGMGYEMIVDS
jgi:hypothetical protein